MFYYTCSHIFTVCGIFPRGLKETLFSNRLRTHAELIPIIQQNVFWTNFMKRALSTWKVASQYRIIFLGTLCVANGILWNVCRQRCEFRFGNIGKSTYCVYNNKLYIYWDTWWELVMSSFHRGIFRALYCSRISSTYPSQIIIPTVHGFLSTIPVYCTLKEPSGQIRSAWEWYHRIGLEKDINCFRFFNFNFNLEYLKRLQSSGNLGRFIWKSI